MNILGQNSQSQGHKSKMDAPEYEVGVPTTNCNVHTSTEVLKFQTAIWATICNLHAST